MSGQLELNAFLPLLADALLESLTLLDAACEMFRGRCVEGIAADAAACEEHVHRSWATVVALVPAIGYEAAVEVARQVRETGITVPQAVLEQGLLSAPELRELLSAEAMTVLGQGGRGRKYPGEDASGGQRAFRPLESRDGMGDSGVETVSRAFG
jgi:aspartate ammonia-lyase